MVRRGSDSASVTLSRKRSRSSADMARHSSTEGPIGIEPGGEAGVPNLVTMSGSYPLPPACAKRAHHATKIAAAQRRAASGVDGPTNGVVERSSGADQIAGGAVEYTSGVDQIAGGPLCRLNG